MYSVVACMYQAAMQANDDPLYIDTGRLLEVISH